MYGRFPFAHDDPGRYRRDDEGMTHTDARVPQTPQATPAGSRLPLLDVLRGVAILGTLMTNVWIFTGPGAEWGALESGMATGPVESTFGVLANGKFLSLLTILFGVGLAIQYDSAKRRGQPWPGRYRWRALFLFAEGTVHFVLVFAWDVLMGYAVTALLVAWLLTRSERAQRRVMWWAVGIHLTLMVLLTAAIAAAGDGTDDGTVSREVVDLYAHGSYPDQIAFRLENALALRMEPVLTFFLLLFCSCWAYGCSGRARSARTRPDAGCAPASWPGGSASACPSTRRRRWPARTCSCSPGTAPPRCWPSATSAWSVPWWTGYGGRAR